MGGFMTPTSTPWPWPPKPTPPRPSTLGQNYTESTPGTTYTHGMDFPSGNDDMKNFFMEMARRKMLSRRPAAPAPHSFLGARGEVAAAPAPTKRRDPNEHLREEVEAAKLRGEQDQLAAASGRAPMKLVTIAGQSFYVPDELAMNAYQRKLFLPNEAGFGADPSPIAAAVGPADNRGYGVGQQTDINGDPVGTPQGGGGGSRGGGGSLTPASTAMPIGEYGGRDASNDAAMRFYRAYGRYPSNEELASLRARGTLPL